MPLTAEQTNEARRLLEAGYSKRQVTRILGCSDTMMRRALDPDNWAKRLADNNRKRAAERAALKAVYPLGIIVSLYPRVLTDAELAARRALVPDDTRTITAALMGDPIPNDKRRRA